MSYARDFATIRKLLGNPTMRCIRPRAQWTNVPGGYAYDPAYDRFVDTAGVVWDETTAVLPYDTVAIIPLDGQALLDLAAGGVVATGDRVVHVSADDYATVSAAAWIVLDDMRYDVVELTPYPAAVPLWYNIHLRRR